MKTLKSSKKLLKQGNILLKSSFEKAKQGINKSMSERRYL